MGIAYIIVGLLVALIAGYCIGKAQAEITHLRAEIKHLQAEITHLREQIASLEAAQAKHLPYRSAEEIENATAAILRMKFESDFHSDVIDNALAHLQKARSGKG